MSTASTVRRTVPDGRNPHVLVKPYWDTTASILLRVVGECSVLQQQCL